MPPYSSSFESSLARQFLHILRWAAASSALGACVETHDVNEPESVSPVLAPMQHAGGRFGPTCQGSTWQPLRGINPGQSWHYVSFRGPSVGLPSGSGRVLQELGTACAGAEHTSDCLEELDAVAREQGNQQFLLATRGDDARAFAGASAVELFGEVDRPDEAIWLARTLDPSFDPCAEGVEVLPLDSGVLRVSGRLVHAGMPCQYAPAVSATSSFVRYEVARDGKVTRTVNDLAIGCPVPGRRPAGLCGEPTRAPDEALGALLAREAHAEAASVWAFASLERELAAHGAPRSLRVGAGRARYEEARHARAMAALARRFGVRPTQPRVSAQPLRSLSEIALDNAAEGCVRETYAALRVAYQVRHARDSVGAHVLAQLAEDELRHAAWSWQLARWAEPRLSTHERRRVRAARKEALVGLSREVDHAYGAEAQQLFGYPSRAAAHQLASGLNALVNELS